MPLLQKLVEHEVARINFVTMVNSKAQPVPLPFPAVEDSTIGQETPQQRTDRLQMLASAYKTKEEIFLLAMGLQVPTDN